VRSNAERTCYAQLGEEELADEFEVNMLESRQAVNFAGEPGYSQVCHIRGLYDFGDLQGRIGFWPQNCDVHAPQRTCSSCRC
jgi:hypothetical protein